MSYWGKLLGGVAGFFVGGPGGAVVGAALGHAADEGTIPLTQLQQGLRQKLPFNLPFNFAPGPARTATLFGQKDRLFSSAVTALAAKLAKCDGPVQRSEIDSFKHLFRIPPDAVRDIGRLFDQARDQPETFEGYARQLAHAYVGQPDVLEDVLLALFNIARADGAVNRKELDFLLRVHHLFALPPTAWDRASHGIKIHPTPSAQRPGDPNTYRPGSAGKNGAGPQRARRPTQPDAYATLGVSHSATNEELHAAWRKLMRENHPDSLAARGVSAEVIAQNSEKVARINAAWDEIKRERRL